MDATIFNELLKERAEKAEARVAELESALARVDELADHEVDWYRKRISELETFADNYADTISSVRELSQPHRSTEWAWQRIRELVAKPSDSVCTEKTSQGSSDSRAAGVGSAPGDAPDSAVEAQRVPRLKDSRAESPWLAPVTIEQVREELRRVHANNWHQTRHYEYARGYANGLHRAVSEIDNMLARQRLTREQTKATESVTSGEQRTNEAKLTPELVAAIAADDDACSDKPLPPAREAETAFIAAYAHFLRQGWDRLTREQADETREGCIVMFEKAKHAFSAQRSETAVAPEREALQHLVEFIRSDQCDAKENCHCCKDYLQVADADARKVGLPEGFACYHCDGDGVIGRELARCKRCNGQGRFGMPTGSTE